MFTTRTIAAVGIWKGEDVEWTFRAEGSLAGGTVAWKLTTEEGGGTTLLTKTGAINGDEFTITITKAETNALAPGVYWHEAKFTNASSKAVQLVAPSPLNVFRSSITS